MSEVASKKKHVIFVACGAFVFIVLAVMFLSNLGSKHTPQSSLPAVQSGARQSSVMTPAYEQNILEYNEQRAKEAERKGGSALPVLTPKSEAHVDSVPPADASASSRQEVVKERPVNQYMAKQMAVLMDQWSVPSSVSEQYALSSYNKAAESGSKGASSTPSTGGQHLKTVRRVADAGMQLAGLTDALIHTDDKMPAFVSVVGGPLMGGKFACKVSRRDEVVAVLCDRMTFGGKTYKANAVVQDLNTGRAVLSGEVDRKLMERYGWPFLAAMASGYGRLIATPNTTSLTIGTAGVTATSEKPSARDILGGAVGAGAEAVSREFGKSKSVDLAVLVPEKTPVSIYLLDSILDDGTPAPEVMFNDSPSGQGSGQGRVIQVPQLQQLQQPSAPAPAFALPVQAQG